MKLLAWSPTPSPCSHFPWWISVCIWHNVMMKYPERNNMNSTSCFRICLLVSSLYKIKNEDNKHNLKKKAKYFLQHFHLSAFFCYHFLDKEEMSLEKAEGVELKNSFLSQYHIFIFWYIVLLAFFFFESERVWN